MSDVVLTPIGHWLDIGPITALFWLIWQAARLISRVFMYAIQF